MNELLQKLHPMVNGPQWDLLKVYLEAKIKEAHSNMESCSPDRLQKFQGAVSAYREMLTLREDVNNVVNNMGTKTQ